MPELKSDSPILEGLMAGQCYADHDGVHCYPAIHLESGDKYIIKVISIPASATQTEALMLTGAITDAEDAKRYFRTLAEGVMEEARTLNELALLEGFLGCERVEMEEDPENNGYLVYLLTPYRESVDARLSQGSMTHLCALNMGLDLCAALVTCRRSGHMYVDLKPANIYINDKSGYCIGDLGFISLKGMKYASLPGKYRSSYTAPEMADCFAELNQTLDIFALGMVLYQAYNGGKLPFEGNAPAELLPPPMYADYELAEIIMKACHPDPSQRWEDPAQLGQALTGYMQRNSIDDVPIVPPPMEETEEEPEVADDEAVEEFLPEMTEAELQAAMAEEDAPQQPEQDELSLIAAIAAEDSSPDLNVLAAKEEEDMDQEHDDEETAQMLAQADELMTLVPPDPVVAPEAIHVPDPETAAEEEAIAAAVAADPESCEPQQDETDTTPEPIPHHQRKKKAFPWKKLTVTAIILLLLAGIGFGGYYYYTQEYLQYVDAIQISGTDHTATVTVITEIDEGILYVVLTDSYGNAHTQALVNSCATFKDLTPQTRYTVELRVVGYHELRGETVDHFTTATQTEILSFNATVGPVDGSVNLSFTSSGPEPESWKVIATAEGQPTIVENFTGNTVTVSGLNVGSLYTFHLEPVGELYMSGQTKVEFTAVNILFAQDPQIVECHDGLLRVVWSAPEGETVESWTLRCYNAAGYDVTITTSDLEYTFQDVDHSAATTIEITAAGMIKSVSVSISANPVTIVDYSIQPQGDGTLLLTWNYVGVSPEGGWNLAWTLDGAPQQMIACEQNSALIPLEIPGGTYEFTLCAPSGVQIFGGSYCETLPEAESFAGYKLTAEDLLCQTFRAPKKNKWTWKNVDKNCLTSEFVLEESVYLMLSTSKSITKSKNTVKITYVMHTADGVFVSTESQEMVWNKMWVSKHCILQLPTPTAAGNFVVSVYLDSMLLCELPVSVT